MIKKIILFICLISCMTAIFIFSSQNSAVSGNISGGVTQWIAQRIIPDFNNMTIADQTRTVESMHLYIRKLAHFSIYTLLGMLAFLNISQYTSKKLLRIIISLLFCLVYAFSDEIHQLFTDGRCCSIFDVMIDFSGSVCGNIIVIIFTALYFRLKRNKHPDHQL